MKKSIILLISSFFLATSSLPAEVEIEFQEPEKYWDIELGDGNVRRGIKAYLPQIEKHIQKEAKRYLKEGESLSLTITNIDLAGEYEPWRSPQFDDIRIVKEIYPPRMSLSYELRDAEGNVLSSGEENLIDMNFQYRIRPNSHDDLFYDKNLISDWMRKMVRNAR